MDDADAELQILLNQLEDEEVADNEFRDQQVAVGLLCFIGAEEARRQRAERRRDHRLYLTRPDLLANPRHSTP
jgi:hypothetical protein